MPEEGTSHSLDYMIDIHTNIEQLADMFQSRAGEMIGALNSLEAGAAKVGKSFSDVMQMQMAASLKSIEAATSHMATQMPEMLNDFNDTIQLLTKSIIVLSKVLNKKLGDSVKGVDKEIEDLNESLEKLTSKKAAKDNNEAVEKLGDSIKKTGISFKSTTGIFKKGSKSLKGNLGEIGQAGMQVVRGFHEMGTKAYGNIKSFHDFGRAAMTSLQGATISFQGLLHAATVGVNSLVNILFTALDALLPGLGEVFRALYYTLKVVFAAAMKALKYFTKQFMSYMTTLITAVKSMAKALWKIFEGPIKLIGKGIKWIIGLLGGLSFADAIKGLTTLDTAANDMARTMVGGVTSVKTFHQAYTKLMTDMTETAWKLGASVEDIKTTFVGLASMHIPVDQLQSLATISYQAAKGLGLGVDQATQLVGTLRHVGKLSDKEIKGVLGNFAILQQNIGLSASETQALANAVTDFAKRVRGVKTGSEAVKSFTKTASKLSAVFIKAGIDAQEAANQIQKLFDPAQLENNVALYAKLGMSISDVMNVMQGSEKIPEDMANRFVQLSKQIVAMGPVAGKAYAETMGMTYGMAQQLANVTGNAVDQVNKMFGKTADQERALEEQRIRQEEQMARKLEIARNRMALNMMETMRPILDQLKGFLDVINKMIVQMRPLFQAIGQLFSTVFSQLSGLVDPLTSIVSSLVSFFTGENSGVFQTLVSIFQEVANIIRDLMPTISDIGNTLGQLVGSVIKDLLGALKRILPDLKPILQVLANIFKVIVGNLLDIFDSLLNSLFPKAEDEASGFSSLLKTISSALSMMGKVIGNILGKLKGPLSTIFQVINDILLKVQDPLQDFFNAIGAAFMRFGSVLKTLAERLAFMLKQIDWKRVVSVLTHFIEKRLSQMVQRVEDFTNTVVTEGKIKKVMNAVNWILKIFDKIQEILTRIRNFFHSVGGIVRGFLAAIGDMGNLGKHLRDMSVTTKAQSVYALVETGNYDVAAEKLLKYYNSRRAKFQEAARKVIEEYNIPIEALSSPEKLAKALKKVSLEETQSDQDLLRNLGLGGEEETTKRPVTREVSGYTGEESPLTRETYKGMTDKQADELIEEQKRANSITDKLFSAIQMLNENISELFTDIIEIKRYTREIDANTKRI